MCIAPPQAGPRVRTSERFGVFRGAMAFVSYHRQCVVCAHPSEASEPHAWAGIKKKEKSKKIQKHQAHATTSNCLATLAGVWWKSASGSYHVKTYQGEGFTHTFAMSTAAGRHRWLEGPSCPILGSSPSSMSRKSIRWPSQTHPAVPQCSV